MPTEVIMPKVDMDMASGTIDTWYVAEGEAVAKGDALFSIETDKAAMEVEAPGSGILHHPAPQGAEIPIGEAVAWLYAEGEEVGDPPKPVASMGAAAPASPAEAANEGRNETETGEDGEDAAVVDATAAAPNSVESPVGGRGVRATPRARALAREAGLDLSIVRGSGPRGRVQALDVRSLSADGAGSARPSVAFTPETGRLSVTRTPGGDGAPVVMIHGFASDAMSWAPLEGQLERRSLIRIDLPGHGKSPKLRIGSFAALVNEVRGAFDELRSEPVHLVGHSLGGALCLALADTRPTSVASLTLIAPAGLGPDINGAALAGITGASRAESLGPWLKALVADESLVTDSYVRLAMAGRADPNLRAAQSAMADALFPDGVQAFDLRAALERIAVPTRIVWGRRDAIIPWQHALRAPGRVALHLFDGVGHMPQLELADEVAKIVPPRG